MIDQSLVVTCGNNGISPSMRTSHQLNIAKYLVYYFMPYNMHIVTEIAPEMFTVSFYLHQQYKTVSRYANMVHC
jgi:hypothetical protein